MLVGVRGRTRTHQDKSAGRPPGMPMSLHSTGSAMASAAHHLTQAMCSTARRPTSASGRSLARQAHLLHRAQRMPATQAGESARLVAAAARRARGRPGRARPARPAARRGPPARPPHPARCLAAAEGRVGANDEEACAPRLLNIHPFARFDEAVQSSSPLTMLLVGVWTAGLNERFPQRRLELNSYPDFRALGSGLLVVGKQGRGTHAGLSSTAFLLC
jgi:hypothetical protein